MKQENKDYLEANIGHWITLRDAGYMKMLTGDTRSNFQRIMAEEFSPGYTADLWCSPCVSEMVTHLYQHYEKYKAKEAAKAEQLSSEVVDTTVPEETKQPEVVQSAEGAKVVKANFPSAKPNNKKPAA